MNAHDTPEANIILRPRADVVVVVVVVTTGDDDDAAPPADDNDGDDLTRRDIHDDDGDDPRIIVGPRPKPPRARARQRLTRRPRSVRARREAARSGSSNSCIYVCVNSVGVVFLRVATDIR